ncbi:hypothetical protein GCM10014715_45020 [Streptomyces spiralis]|uniref:Uncharacterized protein n=1 Tax=Streptomyces spiralis TaxID=66376 RepID=A0A919A3M9_9ACTN|nr:hypothetical protein GCM10014715_45020 [Streptomyces spiralis]
MPTEAGTRTPKSAGKGVGRQTRQGPDPLSRIRPLTWYYGVGVAGFEPTTSSSRTRSGPSVPATLGTHLSLWFLQPSTTVREGMGVAASFGPLFGPLNDA